MVQLLSSILAAVPITKAYVCPDALQTETNTGK